MIKVNDTTLTLFGVCSYFCHSMIRGIMLTPIGYFTSVVAGSLGGVTSIGVRTYISKIIPLNELGKVFTLLSIIDTTAPMLASAVLTYVFKLTIDWFPGTCFVLNAILLLIGSLAIIWIKIITQMPSEIQQ